MTRTTGILIGVVLAVLLGVGVYSLSQNNSQPAATNEPELTVNQNSSSEETEPIADSTNPTLEPAEPLIEDTNTISTEIAPRTVTERVEYNLPRAKQGTLTVTVTADEAGVIQDMSYEHQNVDPSSESHHAQFDRGINIESYVGTSLEDIEDVLISGASLTSGAFNTAVEGLQESL